MENVAAHIILPKGLKLKNGMMLYQDATFTLVSSITPFYASVDQVKLVGGPYVKKLPDLTVACMIYEISGHADAHTYKVPVKPASTDPADPAVRQYQLFLRARQDYVVHSVACELLSNVWDMAGARGSKTLANFSVERLSAVRDDGIPQRVQELREEAEKWRIVLNSGAAVGYGGHVKGAWGQKGLYDPDPPAGRTWRVTGMGANAKTIPGFGSDGKPV